MCVFLTICARSGYSEPNLVIGTMSREDSLKIQEYYSQIESPLLGVVFTLMIISSPENICLCHKASHGGVGYSEWLPSSEIQNGMRREKSLRKPETDFTDSLRHKKKEGIP